MPGREFDLKIISLIQKHGALTRKDIENKLGYKNLYRRLTRMRAEEKLKTFRLPRLNDLKGLYDKTIYYIDKEGLVRWFRKDLRKILKKRKLSFIRQEGVILKCMEKLGEVSHDYRSIPVRKEIYEAIRNISKKEEVTIRETVEKLLMDKLNEGAK